MGTPIPPVGGIPTAAPAEAGVAAAQGHEGAAFLSEVFAGQGISVPGAVVPPGPPTLGAVGTPIVPSAPGAPGMPVSTEGALAGGPPAPVSGAVAPVVASPVPPSLAPVVPTVAAQAQPSPVVPPAVDYASRYAGDNATSPDPLASMQVAPDLAPEVPVVEPQNMNQQQNHAWATMRAQANQNRKLAEEYRMKYNQMVEASKKYQEEKSAFGQQLNERDSKIKALEDEIGRVDLTRSTAFREKYDVPIQQVHDKVVEMLRANGYEANSADQFARQILGAAREELPDLLKELPAYVQGMAMIEADKAAGLLSARGAALTEWRSTAEGLAAVEQRGNALISAQHVDKMVTAAQEVIRAMPLSEMPPAYQVTDPEFVADRTAQEQKFRAWVQQAPEEQKYAAMLEGFMAPKTYEMLAQTMRENQQLRAALQARSRFASPPVAGGPVVPPVFTPPPPTPAPTVSSAGYSQAPAVNMAQEFLQKVFSPPGQ